MRKEALDQWFTLSQFPEVASLEKIATIARQSRTLFVVGAGGAFITARQMAYLMGDIAGLPALAVASYDFESMSLFVLKGDLCLAISQSGETADTLLAALSQ
jgi:glutamine---fructose-6-phosphate transaminase (isomerizing)